MCNILESSVDHIEDVGHSNFILLIFLHKITNLLLQLQIVVVFGHATSFQFLLDLAKTLLDLLVSLCLFPFAFLLFVLVDRDEDADGLSCQFIPRLSSRVGSNKHSNHIILCKLILLKSFLSSALVLLLVFCFQFLCAPTIVS